MTAPDHFYQAVRMLRAMSEPEHAARAFHAAMFMTDRQLQAAEASGELPSHDAALALDFMPPQLPPRPNLRVVT